MSGPIFNGCDEIIDRWLGIDDTWAGKAPRYQHKYNLLQLQEHPPKNLDGLTLVQALLDRITTNWKNRTRTDPPSSKNWRFNKQPFISPDSGSPEKTLEKAIVRLCGDDWANQIPTCSGLVDEGGRHCNIDLGCRGDNEYTFIELKVDTNTPLYAALETLQYGLVYVFSRQFIDELGYSVMAKPVLGAKRVQLRVLAPVAYYAGYQLCWLERTISDGLLRFTQALGYGMDFQFEQFPESFQWPCSDTDLAKALAARHPIRQE